MVGSPELAVSLLTKLAKKLQPQAEKKLQKLQGEFELSRGVGQRMEPWDLEWTEELLHQRQLQHQPRAMKSDDKTKAAASPWTLTCSLETVLERLSWYLDKAMGIRLIRHESTSTRNLEEESPQHTTTSGNGAAIPHRLILRLLQQRSSRPAVGQGVLRPLLLSNDCGGLLTYDVMYAGRRAGCLAVDPRGGYGTRLLTHGQMQEAEPLRGEAVSCQDRSVDAPVVLVGLNWQGQGRIDPLGTTLSAGLLELVHEMGHALHFLLGMARGGSSASSDFLEAAAASGEVGCGERGPPPAGGRGKGDMSRRLTSWAPPIEVLELPSSLFEHLVKDADVLPQILPRDLTGDVR